MRRERSPAVKRAALSCTSRSSFRSGVPFANRSRPTAPVRESFAPVRESFAPYRARSRTVRDFVACKASRHGFGLQPRERGAVGGGKLGVAVSWNYSKERWVSAEMGAERKPGFFQISRIKAL